MATIDQIFGVHGKIALITGGYRGIGAAISLGLAEMGAKIAVTGIEGAQANEFAESLRARPRRLRGHLRRDFARGDATDGGQRRRAFWTTGYSGQLCRG